MCIRDSIHDVYNLLELLQKQDDLEIVEIKDYINNPKPNGYRSLHVIVRIPVYFLDKKELIPVEVQLRTIAMDFWASLEHDLKYKSVSEVQGIDSYDELDVYKRQLLRGAMVSEFGIFLPFRARGVARSQVWGVARFTQSSHPKAAAISTRPAASNRMKRSMLAESAAWPAGSPKRSHDSPARPMARCV